MIADALFPRKFLRDERLGVGDFGEVWSAREIGNSTAAPVHRVVRLLDASVFRQHDVRDSLFQRAAQLNEIPFPFVSVPTHVEALDDGSIAIVEPDLQTSLVRLMTPDRQFDPVELEQWVTQILTGLAALHSAKLAHGDIRLGNVFLANGENAAQRTAWLGDALVGPLPCWSQGLLINTDAAEYRPPEWGNEWREPEPRADLYALGVVLWKILCPSTPLPKQEPGVSRARQISRHLKSSNSTWSLKKLTGRLLTEKSELRPESGSAALREFQEFQRRSQMRPFRIIAASTIACFVAAATFAWVGWNQAGLRSQELQAVNSSLANERDRTNGLNKELFAVQEARTKLEGTLHKKEDEFIRLTQQVATKDLEIGGLQSENKRLQAFLPKPTVPGNSIQPRPIPVDSVEIMAKTSWERAVGKSNFPDKQLELAGKAIQSEANQELRKRLQVWEKEFRNRWTLMKPYAAVDRVLRERMAESIREPWKSESKTAAQKRLDALKEAAREWSRWAHSPKMTPGDVEQQLQHEPLRSSESGRILSAWWAQIQPAQHPEWTLQLVRAASAKPGYGTYRQISVGAGTWGDNFHDWDDAQSHTYPNDDTAQINFQWKPGEPIGFRMYGERQFTSAYTRANLIDADDVFQGPLALWLMKSWGGIQQGGFSVNFDIPDCPGPPPGIIKTVEKSLLSPIAVPNK